MPRPRLVARLDEGLERRLTLVAGPAGFGKTTVLGEWLCRTERPVGWVTLDDSDDDVVTFFSYLVAAVRTVYPDACAETSDLLEARSGPPSKLLAATLANDLDFAPGDLVLVLDDLQCVTDLAVHGSARPGDCIPSAWRAPRDRNADGSAALDRHAGRTGPALRASRARPELQRQRSLRFPRPGGRERRRRIRRNRRTHRTG
ncbi:MAG: AAA family ATPase [Blastocatellia bacterium]|nr:AAA family ATPase [Blastocatellia bacterium]